MVTRALGNSCCTAIAITWLMEWRVFSSWGLSLVLGSSTAADDTGSNPLRMGILRSLSVPTTSSPNRAQLRRVDVSYLLWCLSLVGVCGVQRIYNRRPLSGVIYLFTFGFLGIGTLVDLFLIPGLVGHANAPTLLERARNQQGEPEPLDRQLLLLARRSGEGGFSLNDALLTIQPPGLAQLDAVRAELDRMQHADLLLVGSDERGRVIYREP